MQVKDYCDDTGKYAENDRYLLRRLQENDKEDYMNLRIESSSISAAYKMKSFYEETWKDSLQSQDLRLSLFCRDKNVYLGDLSLRNLLSDAPEIGIDIVKEFRNKGIGYEAVKLLVKHAKEVSGLRKFEVRIYSDNIASRKLFEKLGAKEIEQEDSEFISAMKEMEKSLGPDHMKLLRTKHAELFERAENRHIILYELEC